MYEIRLIGAGDLPPGHAWALVDLPTGTVLYLKAEAVTYENLAEAWLAYGQLGDGGTPDELPPMSAARLFLPGDRFSHVVPFGSAHGGLSGGISVCGLEPWLGEHDNSERAEARSLPLCPVCARWSADLGALVAADERPVPLALRHDR